MTEYTTTPVIYRSELKQYRRDSNRAKKQLQSFRWNKVLGPLQSIMNRTVLPNSTASIMLALTLTGLAHTMV